MEYPPFQLCSTDPTKATQDATVHYFDGHVLAYFLVSRLQFIDPLNRRNLLEIELQSLDNYLAQFKLGKANVVEAWKAHEAEKSDAAGGSAGDSRVNRFQSEANNILLSLFDDRKKKRENNH